MALANPNTSHHSTPSGPLTKFTKPRNFQLSFVPRSGSSACPQIGFLKSSGMVRSKVKRNHLTSVTVLPRDQVSILPRWICPTLVKLQQKILKQDYPTQNRRKIGLYGKEGGIAKAKKLIQKQLDFLSGDDWVPPPNPLIRPGFKLGNNLDLKLYNPHRSASKYRASLVFYFFSHTRSVVGPQFRGCVSSGGKLCREPYFSSFLRLLPVSLWSGEQISGCG
ncbi:hypothetical protein MBM_01693 [Drepanopeziza brunnea f. sp. 'multigermtubi' MB_m1]|uniref:Uncharacterized protein n=1 Tax=Marssonina brunnea f. sp. multigermtubi (strain MB_m1) TaxID=1072389 RepID=K1X3E9_MARBU|nr:uncharacterized protein MBM_01693 [Drepanopeziza brunnea f. sp. 'multigermtubi' MB_m1]EKD19741.1 hypothetical protein MBM_01693 [Drepanopeziza brunnea f. sp. 'multigermtubi' MB_m1]